MAKTTGQVAKSAPPHFQRFNALVDGHMRRMTIIDLRTYLKLLKHMTRDGDAWPDHTTIALSCGCSVRAVLKSLAKLESLGLVVKEKGGGRGHKTSFALPIVNSEQANTVSAFTECANSEQPRLETVNAGARNSERPGALYKDEQLNEQHIEQPKRETIATIAFPVELSSPDFAAAWNTWEKHRREIRKKLTSSTIQKQLKKLAELGEAHAIASIEQSIEKGWTGLFEVRKNGHARGRHLTSTRPGDIPADRQEIRLFEGSKNE